MDPAASSSAIDGDMVQLRRATFLIVLVCVTLVNVASFVAFWRKRELQPIKGRYPAWTLLFHSVVLLFVITASMRSIVNFDTVPCWFNVLQSHIGVPLLLNFVLIRVWLLYFDFNVAQEAISRPTILQMCADWGSDSDERITQWFLDHRSLTKTGFLIGVLSLMMLAHAATPTWFMVHLSSRDQFLMTYLDDGCDRILPDVLLAGIVLVYVVVIFAASYKLRAVVDGLVIKTELRFLAFFALVGAVPYVVWVSLESTRALDRRFPYSTLWLIVLSIPVLVVGVIYPTYLASSPSSLLEKLKKGSLRLIPPSLRNTDGEFYASSQRDLNASTHSMINLLASPTSSQMGDRAFALERKGSTFPFLSNNRKSSSMKHLQTDEDGKYLHAHLMYLLREPQGLKAFRQFLKLEFSVENLLFLEALDEYQRRSKPLKDKPGDEELERALTEHAQEIFEEFIRQGAPLGVNISGKTLKDLRKNLHSLRFYKPRKHSLKRRSLSMASAPRPSISLHRNQKTPTPATHLTKQQQQLQHQALSRENSVSKSRSKTARSWMGKERRFSLSHTATQLLNGLKRTRSKTRPRQPNDADQGDVELSSRTRGPPTMASPAPTMASGDTEKSVSGEQRKMGILRRESKSRSKHYDRNHPSPVPTSPQRKPPAAAPVSEIPPLSPSDTSQRPLVMSNTLSRSSPDDELPPPIAAAPTDATTPTPAAVCGAVRTPRSAMEAARCRINAGTPDLKSMQRGKLARGGAAHSPHAHAMSAVTSFSLNGESSSSLPIAAAEKRPHHVRSLTEAHAVVPMQPTSPATLSPKPVMQRTHSQPRVLSPTYAAPGQQPPPTSLSHSKHSRVASAFARTSPRPTGAKTPTAATGSDVPRSLTQQKSLIFFDDTNLDSIERVGRRASEPHTPRTDISSTGAPLASSFSSSSVLSGANSLASDTTTRSRGSTLPRSLPSQSRSQSTRGLLGVSSQRGYRLAASRQHSDASLFASSLQAPHGAHHHKSRSMFGGAFGGGGLGGGALPQPSAWRGTAPRRPGRALSQDVLSSRRLDLALKPDSRAASSLAPTVLEGVNRLRSVYDAARVEVIHLITNDTFVRFLQSPQYREYVDLCNPYDNVKSAV